MAIRIGYSMYNLVICVVISVIITMIIYSYQSTNGRCDGHVKREIAEIRRYLEFSKPLFTLPTLKRYRASQRTGDDELYDRRIPRSRNLDRFYRTDHSAAADFTRVVTVLIYADDVTNSCVISQIVNIRKVFPTIKIIITSKEVVSVSDNVKDGRILILAGRFTEGKALNTMLRLVETEYFLYLSRGATISDFDSDNGPGWLYHALLSVPEVDFVGGAYLWYNSSLAYMQYETQCYRLKMCQWVFSQTYEYQYSVGDMMICEETSPSFMGRTASVFNKVGEFDPDLVDMALTDFFWRARSTVTVGLRPEVFFTVTRICSKPRPTIEEASFKKKGFMDKYDLREVRDSYGRVNPYPYKSQPHLGAFDYYKAGGVMTPVAYDTMKHLLHMADDFFRYYNVTYFVEAGVALGAIKMRAILPWDGAGDIDTSYYGMKWNDLRRKLGTFCTNCIISSRPAGFGPSGLRHVEIRLPHGEGKFNEFDTREFEETPPANDFLYVFVNGRDIPVTRDFIAVHRQSYGFRYLQTRHRNGELMRCREPGHHACVPDEFSSGGGYWSDFFCRK